MQLRGRLAQNLKRLRLEKRLSQEELAGLADLDRTYISALERAMYSASLDTIEALSIALNVDAQELLAPKAGICR